MVAKRLLPWYGGAPMVWAVSLFFFQTALLVGYAYAHLIASKLTRRAQLGVHVFLLAAAVALFLPPTPAPEWIPEPGSAPALLVLGTLLATAGLPFALLAATTPLLSHWLSETPSAGNRVFRFYAVSNAGSLLGLLLHPLLFEPLLGLDGQERLWALGFVLSVMLIGAAGVRLPSAPARFGVTGGLDPKTLLLAALGSFVLVSVTTHLTRDLAAAPFLWVLPLALYLVTFIVAFSRPPAPPGSKTRMALLAISGVCLVMRQRALGGALDSWVLEAALALLFLFLVCFVIHGMVAARRPDPTRLTGFYLSLTAGGAVGGLLAGLVAPAVFPNVFEYPLVLGAGVAIAYAQAPHGLYRNLAMAASVVATLMVVLTEHQRPIHAERTFFGVVRVFEGFEGGSRWRRDLWNGGIAHGSQWMAPGRRGEPTLYYSRGSGVELALNRHPKRDRREPLEVGVVGLGAGSLNVWAREGDRFRFHELDPAVERAAREYFTYIEDSPATVEVVLGDGRLGLAEEQRAGAPPYDVLILDAFSGDAIPTHLLTTEAFDVYTSRLAEGGVLAFHISNRHVDLAPVLRAQAQRIGWAPLLFETEAAPNVHQYESTWILLTRNADFLTDPAVLGGAGIWVGPAVHPRAHHRWTDDSSNLLGVLR